MAASKNGSTEKAIAAARGRLFMYFSHYFLLDTHYAGNAIRLRVIQWSGASQRCEGSGDISLQNDCAIERCKYRSTTDHGEP